MLCSISHSKLPHIHLNTLIFRLEIHLRTYLNSILSPLVAQIQEDFQRCSFLPLSLVAQLNSVKMNTLRKLSYLFQYIPIFLPQSFFCKLDSLVTGFMWNKKVPRLHRELLQRPRSFRGLALHNFRFYYCAANLKSDSALDPSGEVTCSSFMAAYGGFHH